MESKLTCLISLVLQEVRLIEDYLQLFFTDGTILNVYNVYEYDGQSVTSLEAQEVITASENDQEAVLSFSNGSRLVIGLKDDDYIGPEAMELIRKGEDPVVWN